LRALARGYSNILPKNEFPETAMVPTHIIFSVYEHFEQMFKECSKVRAERRAGELLRVTVKPGNPQLSHDVTIKTLPDGISRKQSSRWRETPGRGDRGFHLGKRGALDIMLAFSPTRAYQENEPARCANTRQALTTQYRRY
jgi:hypothetical protein